MADDFFAFDEPTAKVLANIAKAAVLSAITSPGSPVNLPSKTEPSVTPDSNMLEVVRVTSATPTSSRYPAQIQSYDAVTPAWSDLNATQDSWAVDISGNALATGKYLARRQGAAGSPEYPVFTCLFALGDGYTGDVTVVTDVTWNTSTCVMTKTTKVLTFTSGQLTAVT